MAVAMLGKDVAQALTARLEEQVKALRAKGVVPCLAIVRVGERPDDLSYERGALKRMATVGIEVKQVLLPEDVSQHELEAAFGAVNDDPAVHGILMFQPLPKHLDAAPLTAMLRPEKDVDGTSPLNAAKVFSGDQSGFAPCTPSAVMEMLDYYGVALSGKRVTVIGRSMVVGRPLAMLLLQRHATVTICHTRTVDLPARVREADIVIACAGKARMVTADMISDGAVVIDVGINVDENGQLVGDVDYEPVAEKAAMISPVPGGVGSVTTSVLAAHVTEAASRS